MTMKCPLCDKDMKTVVYKSGEFICIPCKVGGRIFWYSDDWTEERLNKMVKGEKE